MLIPEVITRTARGERRLDIFSSLLIENIICVNGFIDDHLANLVIAQILFLEGEDPDREISLYINSPGGSMTAVLAIYDTMQYVRPDICTICIGQAASSSALIVAAGTHGKRFALANARIVISQPALSNISGQATDIGIYAEEMLRLRSLISHLLATHTRKSRAGIEQDIERDLILNAPRALDYGLIDAIYVSRVASAVETVVPV
ncbi:MAG: ATP-dependent Clp protease proteolytic subunit [Acidobacteriota bacterium]